MKPYERFYYAFTAAALVAVVVKFWIVGNVEALDMALVAALFLAQSFLLERRIAKARRIVDDIKEGLRLRGVPPP